MEWRENFSWKKLRDGEKKNVARTQLFTFLYLCVHIFLAFADRWAVAMRCLRYEFLNIYLLQFILIIINGFL